MNEHIKTQERDQQQKEIDSPGLEVHPECGLVGGVDGRLPKELWMKLLVAGGLTYTNERASSLVRPVRSLLGVAVLLRKFVMSGRPRKAQRRRSGDRNNWKRRYVSAMSLMGSRWEARWETTA